MDNWGLKNRAELLWAEIYRPVHGESELGIFVARCRNALSPDPDPAIQGSTEKLDMSQATGGSDRRQ